MKKICNEVKKMLLIFHFSINLSAANNTFTSQAANIDKYYMIFSYFLSFMQINLQVAQKNAEKLPPCQNKYTSKIKVI